MIVYVSIGNSDDKLTQREWSMFCLAVDEALSLTPKHGVWFSAQDSAYQNACWCFDVDNDGKYAAMLKSRLAKIAAEFRQDSITWAVADTQFLSGVPREETNHE
jgi:hypothetical protein